MTRIEFTRHNVRVRMRHAAVIVFVIALAALALTALRLDDARATAPLSAGSAPDQSVGPPAPDAEPPAIVRAAVTPPAHAASPPACDAREVSHPARDVWTAFRRPSLQPNYDVSRPRTFPLLI